MATLDGMGPGELPTWWNGHRRGWSCVLKAPNGRVMAKGPGSGSDWWRAYRTAEGAERAARDLFRRLGVSKIHFSRSTP